MPTLYYSILGTWVLSLVLGLAIAAAIAAARIQRTKDDLIRLEVPIQLYAAI